MDAGLQFKTGVESLPLALNRVRAARFESWWEERVS